MSSCEKYEENCKNCACESQSCERRGKCCECVAHHRKNGGLPACFR